MTTDLKNHRTPQLLMVCETVEGPACLTEAGQVYSSQLSEDLEHMLVRKPRKLAQAWWTKLHACQGSDIDIVHTTEHAITQHILHCMLAWKRHGAKRELREGWTEM